MALTYFLSELFFPHRTRFFLFVQNVPRKRFQDSSDLATRKKKCHHQQQLRLNNAEHMTIPATVQPRTGTCDDNIKTNLTDLRCKNAVVKLPSSIQGGEFIDQISDYQVLNKNSVLYLKLQLFRGNQNKLINTLPSRNSRKQFVTIKRCPPIIRTCQTLKNGATSNSNRPPTQYRDYHQAK